MPKKILFFFQVIAAPLSPSISTPPPRYLLLCFIGRRNISFRKVSPSSISLFLSFSYPRTYMYLLISLCATNPVSPLSSEACVCVEKHDGRVGRTYLHIKSKLGVGGGAGGVPKIFFSLPFPLLFSCYTFFIKYHT